jgi:alpha-beta hydrolase superfamily lysophospholipase
MISSMSLTASDSTLSTYTALDGDNIALQDWPLPDALPPRGTVLLVHGLGEHAGRHDGLAKRLNSWRFAVRGYDQYGHGESGGLRGSIPTADRLLDDLGDIVDSTRLRMAPGAPLILLGHSLGGLVTARFLALQRRVVEGLVLSSPALDPGLNPLQRLLLSFMPSLVPNFTVANGLDAGFLSHDPAVVEAYRNDPLVHSRISGRLARFIADAGPATVAAASGWTVPTLLLYAGADRLVNPAGSRAFAAAAPAGVVITQCFDAMYHEIFREPDPEAVYAALKQWLDARFDVPARPAPRPPAAPAAANRN